MEATGGLRQVGALQPRPDRGVGSRPMADPTPFDLPDHYRTHVRRLVRFGVVFLVVGLAIGIVTVELQRSFRYGPEGSAPRVLDDATRAAERTRARVDLPPGLMWEVGIDLRLSHGHVVLIGAV